MRIAEAVEACGLSAYTIRFYEKSGMLPEIERGADGCRRFTHRHVEWMTLLYWLRETGMPLKQMRQFAALAKEGNVTVAERRQILLDHADRLKVKRTALEKCESVLSIKIASYGPVEKDNNS